MKSQNIICIAPHPWDDLWRRRHQVMSRLAEANRVLFVEPPISLLTPLRKFSEFVVLKNMRHGFRQVRKNLFIYPTCNIFPFARFGLIKSFNYVSVLTRLNKVIKKLAFEDPILWIYYNPLLWSFIGELGEKMVCYDCYDKITGFGGDYEKNRQEIEEWEKEVVQQADIVFSAHLGLVKYLKSFNDNVSFVPNGVDNDMIIESHDRGVIPSDIQGIPKPVIAYIGSFGNKVDFDTIRFIAEQRSNWSVVLIGPLQKIGKKYIKKLHKLNNVYMLGEKSPDILPEYYKAIDVGLLTLKQNEQVAYMSNPNKLFEYMARGKPVVSVPIEGIEQYSDLLKVAISPQEFVHCIEEAIEEDNQELASKRIEIARNNTWDQRVRVMSKLIEEKLVRNGQQGKRI